MTTKMKGLLKGLRYISQIFDADDDEKEPEMMIGYPTDVKHVAHIGWDGPSEKNSPSWMNDFKPPSPRESSSSAPSSAEDGRKHGSSFHGANDEPSRGVVGTQSSKSSPAPGLPEVPKSSRHSIHSLSSGNASYSAESPTKAKSEKHRPPRRSSKGSHDGLEASDASKSGDPSQLSDLPKKSRRKKPKDPGVSARSSSSRSSKPLVADSSSSSTHENESVSSPRRNILGDSEIKCS